MLENKTTELIHIDDEFYFDETDESLRFKDRSLTLTDSQKIVMNRLLRERGRVVSRNSLMMDLWQTDTYISEGTLTTCVSRLRSRLRKEGFPDPIITKKGLGYLIGA